jgi:hypothetical protein
MGKQVRGLDWTGRQPVREARVRRSVIIASLLAVTIGPMLLAQPPTAQAQVACDFTLGFRTLRDMIVAQHGDIVGSCRENEWHNAQNGDGLQQTTGGLMVWRKADNWTAFTNGSITWINGPFGLAVRPNAGPLFSWESPGPVPAPPAASSGTAMGGSPAPAPAPTPAPTPVPAASSPVVQLELSDENIDQNESFTLIVEADDPEGVNTIWWSATSTDDDELRDTHAQDCSGASTCRRSWQVSTDDTGEITFHARARNTSGVESEEVTLELRVREAS